MRITLKGAYRRLFRFRCSRTFCTLRAGSKTRLDLELKSSTLNQKLGAITLLKKLASAGFLAFGDLK